eukprot:COSAG05_NODE_2387_length_3132_cov_1.598088_2_plen_100_part_00
MLTPELPPKIQTLEIRSVLAPSPALKAAETVALTNIHPPELAPLVLPVRRVSWVACDGERQGMLKVEGARVDCNVSIDLDDEGEPAHFLPIVSTRALAA